MRKIIFSLPFLFLPFTFVLAQNIEIGPPVNVVLPELGPPPAELPGDFAASPQQSLDEIKARFPNLEITDFAIGQKEISSGQVITGRFTVHNFSSFSISGAKFTLSLANIQSLAGLISQGSNLSLPPALYNPPLSGYEIGEEPFDLLFNGSATKSFSFQTPSSLASGNYLLWVTVFPPRDLGFFSQPVSVAVRNSVNPGLQVSGGYYQTADFSEGVFLPLSGPGGGITSLAGEKITIAENLKSETEASELQVKVNLREYNFAGPIVKEFVASTQNISRGERAVYLTLPLLSKPGVYFATILLSSRTSKSESFLPNSYLRFPIWAEGDQVQIKNVAAKSKDKGLAEIEVSLQSPLNPGQELKDVRVVLKIFDPGSGKEKFSGEKKVDFSGDSLVGSSPIITFDLMEEPAPNSRLDVWAYKGDLLLDYYLYNPSNISSKPKMVIPSSVKISLAVLLGAILAYVLVRQYEKEGRLPPSVMVLIILGILFFAGSSVALAATWARYQFNGCWQCYAVWSNPQEKAIYSPGEQITFSGGAYNPFGTSRNRGCRNRYWNDTATEYMVISNSVPSGASGLDANKANIDSIFSGTNYVVYGPYYTSETRWYTEGNCIANGISLGFSQNIAAPSSGSKGKFNGPAYAFMVYSGPGFIMAGYSEISIKNPSSNPSSPGSGSGISFSASSSSIEKGQSVTLSWSATGYSGAACSINQGIGVVPTTGTKTVSPAETTIYTITCGSASETVQVTVVSPGSGSSGTSSPKFIEVPPK